MDDEVPKQPESVVVVTEGMYDTPINNILPSNWEKFPNALSAKSDIINDDHEPKESKYYNLDRVSPQGSDELQS